MSSAGKSTTLAALIREINRTQQKHVITIEDPIEYFHQNDTPPNLPVPGACNAHLRLSDSYIRDVMGPGGNPPECAAKT